MSSKMQHVMRLGSSPLIHTPGIFRWAQHGYKFKEDRQRMINIFVEGYGLTKKCANDILSGRVPVEIDEESGTVSFAHPNPSNNPK
jgi:hypothetical protein